MQDKQHKDNLSWNKDLYQSALLYKNIMVILAMLLAIGIIICLIWLKISAEENKVEPFVITIDSKTGMATTVDPVTVEEYSANIAVVRSLVIQYIKTREEYMYALYDKHALNIKVLSDPPIYRDYINAFGSNNPTSPYNSLGKSGVINVIWKSIIFPQPNTAQVRISLEIKDGINSPRLIDKIILLSFDFKPGDNISAADRIINPLGFIVKMYKIEDENPNV
jgi:type IV secretion system protein VirB8